MKEICLCPEAFRDKEGLHSYLAQQLAFPSWYGGNLDALHDCLGDVRDEVTLIVRDVEALEEAMGPYARRLMRVLIDASAENPAIHLITRSGNEEECAR